MHLLNEYKLKALNRSHEKSAGRVAFADWRFSLRGSNTEPLLRLNVESRGDEALVAQHVAQIARLIQG